MENADSELIGKGPCPAADCGSSDAFASYSDGHGYCFSCGHYQKGEGETSPSHGTKRKRMADFVTGEVQALTARGITEETCRKFGYVVGKNKDGKAVQIANYRRDGQVVAQKLRFRDKKFSFLGDSKECGLFGQHLWQPGRRLVITEGEIDALSVAQALGLKWPVVSLPNGAQGAAKSIKREIEWVEGFDEVVLMFDMDEPGRQAAEEVAAVLTPGKARIAQLPLKDANEMLVAGNESAIVSCIYEAQTKRPDGVVTLGSLRERVLAPVQQGLPWPWPGLTKLTHGRRYGEVYALGAGTGVGKTDWFMEVVEFTAINLNEKCGLFYLEQPPTETGKRLAGKHANRRFHVPDSGWTQEELTATFDKIDATGNVFLYDHFGSSDWDVVKAKMKHMVLVEGVKHIFLDHLTAFAAEADDEKKTLETITAQIAGFAQQYNVCFYFISHLATPEGKPHEEGGRVMIRHFKGSRAIGFWSHFMFALERNQQAECLVERSTTTFRILKDRFTGQATGHCLFLRYIAESGRSVECDPPAQDEHGFNDESSGRTDY